MSAGDSKVQFQQITERAQSQLQWWNCLVKSSGGALNPTKCCCAFYYWQPDKNGILCLTDPPPADSVITAEPGSSLTQLPVLALAEGTQYLGVYITRNGSTKPMEDHVWKKAITYMRAFQRTHMSHRKANVLYQACFLPALTYSFPTTWLSEKFLAQIQTLSM